MCIIKYFMPTKSVVMKIRNPITVEPANDLIFSILEATEEASLLC